MTAPQLASVDSSSISAIGYDAAERTLWVQFVSGRTYRYDDVPKATYEQFMRAESTGRYFNHEIRNNYAFTPVSHTGRYSGSSPSSPSARDRSDDPR